MRKTGWRRRGAALVAATSVLVGGLTGVSSAGRPGPDRVDVRASEGRPGPDRVDVPASEGRPGPYRVNVLTYNVCAANNSDNTCTESLKPDRRRAWAGKVAALVRQRNVDVASFTEMCYAQVDLLQRKLPDYQMVWFGIDRAHSRGGGGDKCRRFWGDLTSRTTPPDKKTFGLALALKGRVLGQPLRRMLAVDAAPSPGSKVHPRGLLCATSMVGPRRSVSCVTHISETESPRQVEDLVARYAGRNPVILGGDFNRKPEDPQLTAVYGRGLGTGRYTEVGAGPYMAQRRTGTPTTRGGRKIDYVFATEADFMAAGAEVIKTRPELSDHLVLAGTFIGKARSPRRAAAPSPGS
ncbi:endonuclease/exonuclease/phosphatase family protein [Planotetraspora silvatica]|uniref:endonuclease/exonuclease/phosphatase family protein n=1 Tax=Planotetraspora silvatica TaxID=234614 RepID=UPI00195157C4|nr:endonuclease/exonuclease/phosphatase family protein [Planotetraspora silvatica]